MESMYRKYLIRLQVVRETKADIGQIGSPKEVVECIRKELQSLDREYIVAVLLDSRINVVGIEEVSKGTLNSALLCSREVYKAATLCNARSIILLHNHPSGDPTPSEEDIKITKRLKNAGDIMGIELLDHITVGSDGTYVSMKARGVL
jgi:DNA repair protein RadC